MRSVFPHIGLWESAGRLILAAADHPLAEPTSTSLLDSGGVARLLAARHPRIVADADRYAGFTRRRESGTPDFLRQYR